MMRSPEMWLLYLCSSQSIVLLTEILVKVPYREQSRCLHGEVFLDESPGPLQVTA